MIKFSDNSSRFLCKKKSSEKCVVIIPYNIIKDFQYKFFYLTRGCPRFIVNWRRSLCLRSSNNFNTCIYYFILYFWTSSIFEVFSKGTIVLLKLKGVLVKIKLNFFRIFSQFTKTTFISFEASWERTSVSRCSRSEKKTLRSSLHSILVLSFLL